MTSPALLGGVTESGTKSLSERALAETVLAGGTKFLSGGSFAEMVLAGGTKFQSETWFRCDCHTPAKSAAYVKSADSA